MVQINSSPNLAGSEEINSSPTAFIPFIFFAYLVILINIFYGYTGISIAKKDYVDTASTPPLSQPVQESI